MKKSNIVWVLLIIMLLISIGCSNEDKEIVNQIDPIERLNESLDSAKKIENMREIIDIEMKIEFDEASIENDETGFAKLIMAMMSNIQMHLDFKLEGLNTENPADISKLKAIGNIKVQYGEEQQEMSMYIENQKIYTEIPDIGLVCESIDSSSVSFNMNQINFNNFLLNQYNEEKIVSEAVEIEFEGKVYKLTKYTYADSLEKILEILDEDKSLGEITNINGETDMDGFMYEDVKYNIYINDDNEIEKIEIGLKVIPQDSEMMLGMKSINYSMSVWLFNVNETVVELPDLSGAVEKQ